MVASSRLKKYTVNVKAGKHNIISDVPEEKYSGLDLGMTPHDLIEAALAACTTITLQMYADRKSIPLESANVEVKITDESKDVIEIKRNIELIGNLTDEQKQSLLTVADKCPIHKILSKPATIL
ncbi:MAG: OsmC family protein [Alphaproteobacteria bacterium]|nr:OsmC family protein [Alphaproteobacteria bacterium]OJV13568.1 MAG: hypothetical protein BGO27_03015 [Alphaproteobacteria bacterium 33-17]